LNCHKKRNTNYEFLFRFLGKTKPSTSTRNPSPRKKDEMPTSKELIMAKPRINPPSRVKKIFISALFLIRGLLIS